MPGGVCVLGSFMMDISICVPRRPAPGETVIGTRADLFLGGKGCNQAIAAARAGSSTSIIGRVGADDWGERFLDRLAVEGIDATHVRVDGEVGTGVGVPFVDDDGENAIVIVPQANGRVTVRDVCEARTTIASSAVLLAQFELPLEVVLVAASLAKAAGATVVVNPAPAIHGLAGFDGLVDVLVPNEVEARALSGTSSHQDIEAIGRRLREQIGADVVVTRGRDGALVVDRDGVAEISGQPVTPVDSVGAGDVFCGVLASALAVGASLRDAAHQANRAAAVAVTRRGAGPSIPTRAELGGGGT